MIYLLLLVTDTDLLFNFFLSVFQGEKKVCWKLMYTLVLVLALIVKIRPKDNCEPFPVH